MEEVNKTEEKQFKPDFGQKASKAYKWKFVLARRIAIGLGAMLLLLAYCLVITLKGNHTLQKQIAEKDVKIIMPNGLTTIIHK